MGVIFLDHSGGMRMFSCRSCGIYLASRDHLITTRFSAASGPAYLFQEVANVMYGEVVSRILKTGKHFVRDVHCKKCDHRLGWYYEFAFSKRQEYKEGCTVLERALMFETVNEVELWNQ